MISDRFKLFLQKFVGQVTAKYDYSGVHGYTVTAQNPDFTLELAPDDPSVDPPLSSVRIMYDSPAGRVTVKKGATCNVMFTNKDPARAFAFGFSPGDYTLYEIGTDGFPIARQGDLVLCGGVGAMMLLTPLPGNVSPSVLPGVPYFVSFGSPSFPPLPATPTEQGKLPGIILSGARGAKAR